MTEDKSVVLIIEDDAGVCRLQQRRLERAGYTVLSAGTAEEGVQRLGQGGVDLVLLDYRLPGERTGLEVYAQLKEAGYDLPVILVTGYSDEAVVVRALRAGVRDFVTKSVEYLDYLPEAVARVLSQVRTEERLREQAALLDQATNAILVRDLQGRIRFWNKGAERLYSWTTAEVVGRNADQLLYKGPAPELEEARRAVLDTGEWSGELREITKEGKEVIVASRWTLMREADGRPKSKLIINTDLTEKKRLEAQLLRTQRMESLGALASGIAHDLNNVLTPILMAVDLLQSALSEDLRETLLAPLQASAEHGAELVKQVLSFTRGSQMQRTEFLQVRHLIRDIEKMLRHTLPKSIELRITVPRDLLPLSADATQLHQVLMNLCVNARDAMPTGGRLTVTAENVYLDENYARMNPQARPGAYVLLRVTDTGTGIPADALDKVFEPFFTTKDQGKGTGLGLFTVQSIIKAHGGFIMLDTKISEGTQFSVYLPAAAKAQGEFPQLQDGPSPAGHGQLVLVADDDSSIRAITRATLEAHGYHVLTAGDGTEAVALYGQHRGEVRAALIDMMMPIMDGPLTIRALQRLNPEIPIIAVSGLTKNGQAPALTSLGAHSFLQKPYTAHKLLTTLADALRSDPELERGSRMEGFTERNDYSAVLVTCAEGVPASEAER